MKSAVEQMLGNNRVWILTTRNRLALLNSTTSPFLLSTLIYNHMCQSSRQWCYELKLKGLSNRTLVLSNTRELDRVPSTK